MQLKQTDSLPVAKLV